MNEFVQSVTAECWHCEEYNSYFWIIQSSSLNRDSLNREFPNREWKKISRGKLTYFPVKFVRLIENRLIEKFHNRERKFGPHGEFSLGFVRLIENFSNKKWKLDPLVNIFRLNSVICGLATKNDQHCWQQIKFLK